MSSPSVRGLCSVLSVGVVLGCVVRPSLAGLGWSTNSWTGDADCGISNAYHYTAAVNINGSAVTVNGVPFDRNRGGTREGAGWKMGGVMTGQGDTDQNISGDSLTLAAAFVYGGTPRVITLTGLTPGRVYVTTFFSVGWGDGTRVQEFATDGDAVLIEQDTYGANEGIRIEYAFVADGPRKVFTITPQATTTFHLYAFCNREIPETLNPADFAWRQQIAFTNYTGGPLLNFPALVTLRKGEHGFDGDLLRSGGADLRFTGADGVSVLDYELDEWHADAESAVWVRVPLMVSNTVIHAYWGNSAMHRPASVTNGVVWGNGYGGVWHLGSTSGDTDGLRDATARGHNAVDNGATAAGAAVVSGGRTFDNADFLTATCPTQLAGNVDFAVSFWMDYAQAPARAWVMDFGQRAAGTAVHFLIATNGTAQFGVWSGNQNQPSIIAHRDRWVHVTTVLHSADRMETYLNGTLVDSDAMTAAPNLLPAGGLRIGQRSGAESYFSGRLDEVRLSYVTRSADWVRASWLNQASNTTYAAYGEAVRTNPDAPLLAAREATDIVDRSATLHASLVSTGSAETVVAVFWGPTDAGRDALAWESTRNLGVVAAALPAELDTAVTGLVPNTTYYFAHRAVNAVGTNWCVRSFVTPGPPFVANGEAEPGMRLLRVHGTVVSNGAASAVSVFWGAQDGGTNIALWAAREELGAVPEGGFAAVFGSPFYGSRYFYRCFATNRYGAAWASATSNVVADVSPVAPDGWSIRAWNDDLDSAINGDDAYTAAANMGGGAASVNGVPFGAYAVSGPGYSIGGALMTYVNHVNNVSGASALLAKDFIHNAIPRTVQLTGLVPGAHYEATFFGVGYEADGRPQTFSSGDDSAVLNEDAYGLGNGAAVSYVYDADDAGARMVSIRPTTARTFHMYALANRVVPHMPGIANLPVVDVSATSATIRAHLAAEAAVFDVFALWGNRDGNLPGEAWAHTNYIGAYTNVGVDLDIGLTGLTGDTNYFYTFMATNLATNMYAAPGAIGFQSGGAPGISNAAPSDVTERGATLCGVLHAGGQGEVTVYWGDADAGAAPGGWGNTTSVGVVISGNFSQPVLATAGRTRYYRCYVTNAYGEDWSDAAMPFTTPLPTLRVADTEVDEGNSGTRYAAFDVYLSSVSASNASAIFATADASAVAGLDYVATNGVVTIPAGSTQAVVHVAVLGDVETEWPSETFRLTLGSPSGCLIAPTPGTALVRDDDAHLTDWNYKMPITFGGYTGTTTLTNFPAAVILGTNVTGFAYSQFASPVGADLRFFDSGERHLLNFEIEEWNPVDLSVVWVQVPELPPGGTVVWACWGNPDDVAAPLCTTNGAVWDTSFGGVWHLDQTNGVEDLRDATANRNDATMDLDTEQVSGRLAGGQRFDGGSDYIAIPDSPSLSVTGSVTFSAWAYPERPPAVGQSENILAKDGNLAYRFRIENGRQRMWGLVNDDLGLVTYAVDHTIVSNTWTHVATVVDFDAAEIRFYADGVEAGAVPLGAKTRIADTAGNLLIGNYTPGNVNEDFIGILDEVRVESGIRSGDWLRACALNQGLRNKQFNGYGPVETTRGGLLLLVR